MARDVQEIPQRSKFVLGVASVWMLFPVLYGVVRAQHAGHVFLLVTLVIGCCASVCMWRDAKSRSTWHVLDQACAFMFFVAVAVNADMDWFWGWFVVTAVFYLISFTSFQHGRFQTQLYGHLLFRFSAYWGAHWVFVPRHTRPAETSKQALDELYCAYFLLTFAHILHVVVLFRLAVPNTLTYNTHKQYWHTVRVSIMFVLAVLSLYTCLVSIFAQGII